MMNKARFLFLERSDTTRQKINLQMQACNASGPKHMLCLHNACMQCFFSSGDDRCCLFRLNPNFGVYSATGYNSNFMYLNMNMQTLPNGLVRLKFVLLPPLSKMPNSHIPHDVSA